MNEGDARSQLLQKGRLFTDRCAELSRLAEQARVLAIDIEGMSAGVLAASEIWERLGQRDATWRQRIFHQVKDVRNYVQVVLNPTKFDADRQRRFWLELEQTRDNPHDRQSDRWPRNS
jgi:hypothetical protein